MVREQALIALLCPRNIPSSQFFNILSKDGWVENKPSLDFE